MGHLKDFIYRYLKDSKQREEEITAKNHHLVQDCLIDARRLLVWLLSVKWTLLWHRPFPPYAHNNILGRNGVGGGNV